LVLAISLKKAISVDL